jgi:hypothetical protein
VAANRADTLAVAASLKSFILPASLGLKKRTRLYDAL